MEFSERRQPWTTCNNERSPVFAVRCRVAGPEDNALVALDAANGKPLYSSESEFWSTASQMAIANGHVCFAAGNTLDRFGIPLER